MNSFSHSAHTSYLDSYVKSINGTITATTIGDTFSNAPALSQEQLAQLYTGTVDGSSVVTRINLEKSKILPNIVTHKLPIIAVNAVFGCADTAYSIESGNFKNNEISTTFHLISDSNDNMHMIAKVKTNSNDVRFTELDYFYGLFLTDRKENYRKEISWISSSDQVFLVAFLRSAPKVAPCETVMVPDSDAAYLMIDSIRQFLRLNATKGGEF